MLILVTISIYVQSLKSVRIREKSFEVKLTVSETFLLSFETVR